MLLIAAATVFMSAPGQSFSVAAFVDPMLTELRVERTNYSAAYTVATLIGGVLLPFIGRVVNKLGARKVLPVVALGLSCACFWMSQLTTAVGLYVGFTAIRCLGQGSLTLISNWIVGEWFERRRGLASGICAIGGTASVLIIPQLNDWLIKTVEWRNAWIVLGAVVGIVLILPSIIFLRDRPEAIGLLPDWGWQKPKRDELLKADGAENCLDADGGVTEASDVTAKPESVQAGDVDADLQAAALAAEPPVSADPFAGSFTVSEAIRTTTFWKVASVVATVSLVGTGLVFHQVSILGEQGVDRTRSLELLGVQAVAATVSTLLAGGLMDVIPVRFVLACSMAFQICALLLLMFLPSPGWAVLYSTLLGLHGGIIRSAGSMVWVNYFGRRWQGAIQGMSMALMVLAAALGPLPVALAHDMTGSYHSALVLFLVLPTVAGIAVLTASPPAPVVREA
jgi:MFS family permease